MRKQLLITIAGLVLVGGLILAAPAAGTRTALPTKLVVAMHDPGCHWFMIRTSTGTHKYVKSVVRHRPVNLVNLDEATLVIRTPGGIIRHEKVGATMTLRAAGLYRITMVRQAADDNHLRLTIQ